MGIDGDKSSDKRTREGGRRGATQSMSRCTAVQRKEGGEPTASVVLKLALGVAAGRAGVVAVVPRGTGHVARKPARAVRRVSHGSSGVDARKPCTVRQKKVFPHPTSPPPVPLISRGIYRGDDAGEVGEEAKPSWAASRRTVSHSKPQITLP